MTAPNTSTTGSETGGTSTATTTTQTVTRPVPAPAAVSSLIARYGSAEAALAVLNDDNHRLRQSRRVLKDEKAAALAKVPSVDDLILRGDEKKQWEKFKTLGKAEEVESKLKEHGTLLAKDAERTLNESAAAAAKDWGYNKDAVLELAKDKKLKFIVRPRSGAKPGEPQNDVLIQEEGDNKPQRPIKEYVEALPNFYQVALKVKDNANPNDKSTTGGNTFVQQRPATSTGGSNDGGGSGTADVAKSITSRYATPSEQAKANGTTT